MQSPADLGSNPSGTCQLPPSFSGPSLGHMEEAEARMTARARLLSRTGHWAWGACRTLSLGKISPVSLGGFCVCAGALLQGWGGREGQIPQESEICLVEKV